MPNIAINSKILRRERKENQLSCDLTLENRGSSAVELLSINPRIPEGIDIQEVHDTSVSECRNEHANICDEISSFVRLLWEKGTAYEHEVIDGIEPPNPNVDC
jgi:hypothetical protein